MTGFVLLAGLAAVDIGALAVARAAAQTAADMAALAALTPREGPVAPAGGSAETRAAELAGANGAELVSCDCSAVQAVVRVRRRQRLVPAGLTLALTASARAVLSQPPATNRATVRAVDHSRAADGSQAKRPRDPASRGTAGRPARERERRDGGGVVRRSVVAVRVAVRDVPPISLAVLRIGQGGLLLGRIAGERLAWRQVAGVGLSVVGIALAFVSPDARSTPTP